MIGSTSTPPVLEGLTLERTLGNGGFADVYLYRQERLQRPVAVKVLRAHAVTDETQQQFQAEAMLMAALSGHNNIVTIHDASIAPDGRPYLVMAYLSGKNLAERYNAERMAVSDVLAMGVQLAGAVETAHREHILHRDIKPANILTDGKGRPVLADFGISVSTAGLTGKRAIAMSIPWSPPEMLIEEPDGDERADVYSLAATLYTLLAGRSPYELPGQSNAPTEVMQRIMQSRLTGTGRADVPASVEQVLARALHKNRSFRPRSAIAFGRELRQLQRELGLPVTEIEIAAEDPQAAARELAPQDDGGTKIKPFRTVYAQNADRTALRPMRLSDSPTTGGFAIDQTRLREAVPRPHLQSDYLQAPRPPVDTEVRLAPTSQVQEVVVRRSRMPLFLGLAAAAVIVAVVTLVLVARGSAPAAAPTGPVVPSTTLDQAPPAAAPASLNATAKNGLVVFTWKNPRPAPGDYFRWQKTDVTPVSSWTNLDKATLTVRAARVCVSVELVRADGELSDPSSLCFPESG